MVKFLEDNNSISPLQKGGRVAEWFTAEETSGTNASGIFLKVYYCTLYTEEKACCIIDTTVI